jgi:hypothetical protein
MANVTMEQAKRTLNAAKTYLTKHKAMIGTVIQGVEGFAAPMLLGIGEGRLANDGSGHISLAGVPLSLGLGAIGIAAAASGWAAEYGSHVGNMATGLLGSYGADLGRQIGLGMRLKAGKAVQANLLAPAKEAEIRAKAAAAGKALPDPASAAGFRVGESFPNQYYSLGATPGPLTSAQLEQMVREAAAAAPTP